MTWNIRLALWLTAILCPRIGKAQPRANTCPDFVSDETHELKRRAAWAEYTARETQRRASDNELNDDDLADWAEYTARCESTRHHLKRCLNK